LRKILQPSIIKFLEYFLSLKAILGIRKRKLKHGKLSNRKTCPFQIPITLENRPQRKRDNTKLSKKLAIRYVVQKFKEYRTQKTRPRKAHSHLVSAKLTKKKNFALECMHSKITHWSLPPKK